ncbi:hypothetical protein [Amycolatopsis sp. PS_44_ISF1]|uniref:hypothetical protein n=1 Tax=Amycolatopsis sp. PS_44_ISF1 TaxID=2974917 RepID=UPI0028DFC9E4|nr:hypothetical protein [Amycolatopsis sp. PS_44_ISF1]MDT8913458.1 hypothetical protein [Amycolatopsis sp. PS_44_ISF1]
MGADWENILDSDNVAEAWDRVTADALYQDQMVAALGQPADQGDEDLLISIDETE